jgi:hypothetical protein
MLHITQDDETGIGTIYVSDNIDTPIGESRDSEFGEFIFNYSDSGELISINYLSIDDLIEFITVYAVPKQ